jgi:protein involved in polysaccharide export with SLBB domain
MSNPSYPVTPGDVYRLAFTFGSEVRTLDIPVQSDFQLNLGVFGVIDALGMTYPKLAAAVQKRAGEAYPGSSPTLTIVSVGQFQVTVTGEVTESTHLTIWGLTRLHEAVEQAQTPYTSFRAVTVIPARGEERTYDLFFAARNGDEKQDPLLRPGDRVLLAAREREIQVAGEVRRPGSYQLMAGEGLAQLLEGYAGGLTTRADASHIQIRRWDGSPGTTVSVMLVDASEAKNRELHDLDVVTIPSRENLMPIVSFEGAVTPLDRTASGVPRTTSRTTVRINEGELLSSLLARTGWFFLPEADVEHCYLVREGTDHQIPINLAALSYRDPSATDIVLEPRDRIVVPALQYFVTVSGAVFDPGQYLMVPGRTVGYYLALAGGINPDRQVGAMVVRITDAQGRAKDPTELIEADDAIFVPTNSPLYFASRIVPVLSGSALFVYYLVNIIRILSGN